MVFFCFHYGFRLRKNATAPTVATKIAPTGKTNARIRTRRMLVSAMVICWLFMFLYFILPDLSRYQVYY